MDWSTVPDLAAVGLLACAFASVSRRGQNPVSGLWLTGWILIVLHFTAFVFLPAPGIWGTVAADVGLAALAAAGNLFMYASIPFRQHRSSISMLLTLIATNTLYLSLINAGPGAVWALTPAAILIGAAPLTVALIAMPRLSHPLRWVMVSLCCALCVFLLSVQHRGTNGISLALNGLLFTVFFACAICFFSAYRRVSAGALITIAGFMAWAGVFVVAPWVDAHYPNIHIENEVWNLPKYLVAVGMILLLLEEQIEHNRYLALHDELTGLPNRRLFLDRLSVAVERARRLGSRMSLLVVDLDYFKEVNDTLGHHAGDLVLQKVAAAFAGRVRRSDTVARTGGDEFSVILEEPTDLIKAKQVADSLLNILEEPLDVELTRVRVGASIGLAIFPDDAADLEALRIAADLRMYDGKNQSRQLRKLPICALDPVRPARSQTIAASVQTNAD